MGERNKLVNGRFLHNLDGWTVSGAEYSSGDGDEHYGVAVLEQNEWISQAFSVSYIRTYTIHLAMKSSGAIQAGDVDVLITDGEDNTVVLWQPPGDGIDTWGIDCTHVGLAPGTTYTVKITNNQVEDVMIDDVWIWLLAICRLDIAVGVNEKLARLASDRSLVTTPDGDDTEGDYTKAVDAGLRSIGAVNPYTALPDDRYVEINRVGAVIDAVMREMLEQLRADYAVEVDISEGPHRESLSQINKAITAMIGEGEGSTPGGRVISRKLEHG